MEKTRKIHLDILRIIAIYFVIFNHTNEKGYVHFTLLEPGVKYGICMVFSVVCKISVPLFFMISGALLLGREESYGEVWRKRILRYFWVIVLFSVLQYAIQIDFQLSEISVSDLFLSLYSKNLTTPYWFLYSYLGFLVMLPLMRKLARGMEARDYHYMFCLYVIFFSVIPAVEYVCFHGTVTMNPNFRLPMILSQTVFYPLMGHWVEKKWNREWKKKDFMLLAISNIAAIGISCVLTQFRIVLTGQLDEGNVQQFFSIFIEIPVISLFLLCKYGCEKRTFPAKAAKCLEIVGGGTFGIYLTERILRKNLYGIYDVMRGYIPSFAAILLYVLLIMVLGLIITLLMKRIPGVRRLL